MRALPSPLSSPAGVPLSVALAAWEQVTSGLWAPTLDVGPVTVTLTRPGTKRSVCGAMTRVDAGTMRALTAEPLESGTYLLLVDAPAIEYSGRFVLDVDAGLRSFSVAREETGRSPVRRVVVSTVPRDRDLIGRLPLSVDGDVQVLRMTGIGLPVPHAVSSDVVVMSARASVETCALRMQQRRAGATLRTAAARLPILPAL